MARTWIMPKDYPAFAAWVRRQDQSRTLRQLYNSTLTERIPDDIRDLIERLD